MVYNWQNKEWPHFKFQLEELQFILLELAEEVGVTSGYVQGLTDDVKLDALLQIMLAEAIKTSAIEGEVMSREDVMSSIKNNLGVNTSPVKVADRRATGIARLMTEVRDTYQEELSIKTLKKWHELLMSHEKNIIVGDWRKGEEPMQVISGASGREIVHFEAPPSSSVADEMEQFVNWFNTFSFHEQTKTVHAVLKSAIAHLYFETIHPFEDGNGRIGRAIAEKALSQSLGYPVMISLSKTIDDDKKAYYNALKEAQSSLEITNWIKYFIELVIDAQKDAKSLFQFILSKSRYFDRFKDSFNERQLKAIKRMLDEGETGFEGGMTAKKYINIVKTSKATATRDLQELNEIGALRLEGAGRSVRYHLNL